MNKYLLIIRGDIEPELKGPFDDELDRSLTALKHRANDPDMHDGLFMVNCKGPINIEAYPGGFFSEIEESESDKIVQLEFYKGSEKVEDVYLGVQSEKVEKKIQKLRESGYDVRKIVHDIGDDIRKEKHV